MLPNKQQQRWRVVNEWLRTPDMSIRAVARRTGVSQGFARRWISRFKATGNVQAAPKTGRKRILSEDLLLKAMALGAKRSTGTAAKVAKELYESEGIKISARTIRRNFRDRGLVWEVPRTEQTLTAKQRANRVRWALKHQRTRTSFKGWMFTDSKIFLVNRTAGKADVKCWFPRGGKPFSAIAKHSIGAHVYLGVTIYGATRPAFVTGAQGQKSAYTNPKTGKLHTGVCSQEYIDNVIPQLIADGNSLFSTHHHWSHSWRFQQDNAAIHKAANTMAELEARLPGRIIKDWPAMSPDLSWIENIWAQLEEKLRRSAEQIRSVAELRAALTQLIKELPSTTYQRHVAGMPKRLVKLVASEGAPIS